MKFAADAMLGRLAKWLRILGHDVSYRHDISDDELTRLAGREGRTILTRDTAFARGLGEGGCIFIKHDRLADQLMQMTEEAGMKIEPSLMFTRCTACNSMLVEAEKTEVGGLVPDYTYAQRDSFTRCPGCGRVYWEGTHKRRILDTIAALRKGVSGCST